MSLRFLTFVASTVTAAASAAVGTIVRTTEDHDYNTKPRLTMRLYATEATAVGVNLRKAIEKTEFRPIAQAVLERTQNPEAFKTLFPENDPVSPDPKSPRSQSVVRDTRRGLKRVIKAELEAYQREHASAPQRHWLSFLQSAEADPVLGEIAERGGIDKSVEYLLEQVVEVTHLSFALREYNGRVFEQGYRGLKRTADLWSKDFSRKGHFEDGAVPERMVVPETETRKPTIYHESRDVALDWVDTMSEKDPQWLPSVGITGNHVTMQFNMPGLPPFFGADGKIAKLSPDETGYETEQDTFVYTEQYGDFMGNQENDGGIHISLLNRMPTEIAARPDVTELNQPYAAADITKVRAMIQALDDLDNGRPSDNLLRQPKPSGEVVYYYVDRFSSPIQQIPIQFTAEFDLRKIKQVQGGARNDRGSTGTNYLGLVVPFWVKAVFVEPVLNYVNLEVNASQQLHISLASTAPSWLPSVKSPQRFRWGSPKNGGELAVLGKAFALFRVGAFPPKAKPSGGWSAAAVTGWEDYETACNAAWFGLTLPKFGLEWKVLPYLGFKAAVVQDTDGLSKPEFYAKYYPYSIWNGEEATQTMRDIKRYLGDFPSGKQVPKGIYNEVPGMFGKVFGMDPADSAKTIVAKAGPKGDYSVEQCEAGEFGKNVWEDETLTFTPIMAQSFKVRERKKFSELKEEFGEAKETKVLAADYATVTPNTAEAEEKILAEAYQSIPLFTNAGVEDARKVECYIRAQIKQARRTAAGERKREGSEPAEGAEPKRRRLGEPAEQSRL